MDDDVTWTIDAPGQWMLDRSHASGGTTPIAQHLMSTAMPAGMRRVFRDNGAPVDTIEVRFVHDFFYTRLRPLISPDKPPKKLPPELVLKIATRLHPEMRRRAKAAQRTLETQPWKKVIHDWHHGGRAAIEEQNLELQDVDLASLDDDAVVAHVRRCIDHAVTSWEHHFWLHGFDLGPLGMYLYEAKQWGLDASELLPLLEGASPSTSAPSRSLRAIRDAVDKKGCEPSTLDELRAISPEISSAVDDYLRYRGTVLFSRYDVDGVTLGERPDLVFASIMGASVRDATADVEALTASVRARVPAEHRARFDELLSGAWSAMDLRDDNGPTTAEWPLGLLRMGLLELGRRMVRAGKARSPEDALELRPDEIRPWLLSSADAAPNADGLAARRAARRERATLNPPASIGSPEVAPPLHVLPPVLARTVGMVQTVMAELGMDGRERTSDLHGAGIGTTCVRGRACVAASSEEALDKLEPGDILVVAYTTPAYNLVLSLAAGVVTSEGGPMSHAAVIARELGIPAVIGAKGASLIPHGSEVEVDPTAGEVRVLSRA